MKTEIITGEEIYEEIKRLEAKAAEIEQGMDAVYEELSTDSIAYTILKDNYAEVKNKINSLMNREYMIAAEKGSDKITGPGTGFRF